MRGRKVGEKPSVVQDQSAACCRHASPVVRVSVSEWHGRP